MIQFGLGLLIGYAAGAITVLGAVVLGHIMSQGER